ncbi:pyrophosphatase PpaX [Paenibacillus koleovorans]|uniref:pyrophosphatase PpaX n=1 Tax=Paenibacillus koleovorans TaxID=121608 RepID=UPI000FD887AB|nr:pyrophosphatase PpaX [Paenibacillus koleovorans]
MIKTIIFDLDGTIVDTNELIIQSFMHTLNGITEKTYAREDIIPHMGYALTEQIKFFTGLEQIDDLVVKYRQFNLAKHDELVREFPHVREVLAALQAGGIRMGVATNKMRMTTELGLKLCGLDPFIDVIMTVEDVAQGKPNPEMILKALEQLGANPSETLMVGDSQYDIIAGREAGVGTVGVAWSLKGEVHLRKFEPTYMIHDMRELLDMAGIKRERA